MIKQLTNLSHTMKCKCYECQIVDKINELVRAHNETGGEYGKCQKCGAKFMASNEERDFGCGMCGYTPKPTKECTCNINLHNSLKDVLEAEKTCEVHKPTLKPQEGWEEEFDIEYEKYNNVFKPPEKWKQFIKEFVRDKFIERKKVEEAIEEALIAPPGTRQRTLNNLKERLL